jgi:hypothetical protein
VEWVPVHALKRGGVCVAGLSAKTKALVTQREPDGDHVPTASVASAVHLAFLAVHLRIGRARLVPSIQSFLRPSLRRALLLNCGILRCSAPVF